MLVHENVKYIHTFSLNLRRMKYEHILIIFIFPNELVKGNIIYPQSHISYYKYFDGDILTYDYVSFIIRFSK